MVSVSVRVDTDDLRTGLTRLRQEGPRAIAEAINKSMFEARLAAQDEIKGVFLFAGGPGGSTERFLTNSVLFQGAKPERLVATMYLRQGARIILDRQESGASIVATDPRVGPEFGGQIAVPNLAVVKRGRGGRIVAADTPKALLQRRARGSTRGYLTRGKIIKREPGTGGRIAFALVDRAKLKPRFDFFGVTKRTIQRVFPAKANRVLEKIRLAKGRA